MTQFIPDSSADLYRCVWSMGHLGHSLAHPLAMQKRRQDKVWDTYFEVCSTAKAQHLGLRRQVSFSIVLDLLKLSKPKLSQTHSGVA